MQSLYTGPLLELLSTLYICPLSCKVDDGDSTISVGASSLSGSFCNSYSNDTCKPGTVGAK